MKKKKMLVFHSALAPYRVDQFNLLGELFDLEIVFYLNNLPKFKYDQDYLRQQCNFKISYLLFGLGKTNRFIRFGLFRQILKTQPDFILSYEYSATTHYLLLLKKLGLISQKIGTMVDDSLDICYNPRSKARYFSRENALKNLDYLVLLSDEVSDYYQMELKFENERIIIFPLLQLPEKLRSNKNQLEEKAKQYQQKYNLYGKKVLLYVGRFAPEKALPRFLNIIHNLLIEDENLVLVMVGDGSEIQSIKNILEKRGLENKVIFAGRYEGNVLHAWYLCASGLVLPSISETFGAVVNESLIFGTKVLCSQLAGASTLITPHNGVIFDPLNENDTREKTKEFLSKIEAIEEIDLSKTPSLMNNHPNDYIKEWEKILL